LELIDRNLARAEQHYRHDGDLILALNKLRPALARILELYDSTAAASLVRSRVVERQSSRR
jgi:hypothetical protein